MNAWVLTRPNDPLTLETRPVPVAGAGEVVIALRAAALNRRDYWITQGKYPGIRTPVVLGSDGAGIVEQVGSGVGSTWVGQEVIINPGWDWGSDERTQSKAFRILGMPVDGTFASHIVVPAAYVHRRPDHLDWFAAAALPLAGVTAFRGLITQGGLQPGEKVLITGIGGGVASTALLLARAAGADVYVTSGDARKRARAVSLGAQIAFDYHESQWQRDLVNQVGTVDLVLDGAGGTGVNALLEVLSPAGRLVSYGATAGGATVDPFRLFWKQLRWLGTTMGSPADFQAMLDFVSRHQLKPIIDRQLPFQGAARAIGEMAASQQFGKTVIRCGD